jgi:hypothetical protein
MRYPAGFISAFYDPLKTPNAPTIGTATAGSSQISVTFTAPSNVGGSAITSYIVTARRTSNGDLTSASGASSPVVVTGLIDGAAYTANVVAVNSYGPSAPSAASNSATPFLTIGQAYAGGFYAGQIGVSGVATHNIVVGPLSSAQNASVLWKNANTAAAGADNVIDGPQNTADMVADGNSTVYPAAHFCNDLTIGGFSDWYMPAKNELEVCYFNLKPTTANNNLSSGTNTNAVPSRGSNYTSGTPAQTAAAAFQTGNSEAFAAAAYWSSTELSNSGAWAQSFGNGYQGFYEKTTSRRVRAIRRVPV